jgi:general stress protein YciG
MPKLKGLALVSIERRKEICSKGGKAAHAIETAHKWDSESASRAGRIGGTISKRGPNKKKEVSE